MIAVIQCAAGKRENAGCLTNRDGTRVMFVADPAKAPTGGRCSYARPDDLSDAGTTWRQVLLAYNDDPGTNPLCLLPAYQLYENPAYQRLVDRLGADKTYILSAGWGLIGAAFLTPQYDITFSPAVRKDAPYKFRREQDSYHDFCHLPDDTDEPVVFFGGLGYVRFFCGLTHKIKARRTIFYNSSKPPAALSCTLCRFTTRTRTNWHYECVNAFLDGEIGRDILS
jgi:hypothetical protein